MNKYRTHHEAFWALVAQGIGFVTGLLILLVSLERANALSFGLGFLLDAKAFAKPIEKAWYALRTRIAADGTLVVVCTGTGKQKSLRDYYDRPAILGPDDRGGAMALMIATEMERYLAEQRK